jgi:hypothetical protein
MRKGLGRHNYRSAGGLLPSLILDFAGTRSLDSRVTFTRSTAATYYNSSGILSTAAINVPRFQYNPSTLVSLGLLVEQSSVNLNYPSIPPTSGFTFSVNVVSALANQTTAPDGTNTATQYNMLAYGTYQYSLTTLTSATTYTVSMYVKGTTNYVRFGVCNSSSSAGFYGTFDLINVTATGGLYGSGGSYTSSTITDVGNGWYRCTVTGVTGTMANSRFVYSTSSTTVPVSYYAWGGQVEALGFATSLITTTSAQVTRAADIPPLPISTWYNTTQGTWFAQVNMLSTAGTPRIVGATPSSKAPMEISNQAAAMFDNVFGVSTANTITANTTQKIAAAWTGTTGQVCLNGGTVATGSQLNGYSDLTTIGIGYNSTANDNFINGTIAKITYYPKALTSAQLQTLTT